MRDRSLRVFSGTIYTAIWDKLSTLNLQYLCTIQFVNLSSIKVFWGRSGSCRVLQTLNSHHQRVTDSADQLTFSPSLKRVDKSHLIGRFSGNLRSRVEVITDALLSGQIGYQTHGRTAHSQVVSAASLAVIAAIGSHSTGGAGA